MQSLRAPVSSSPLQWLRIWILMAFLLLMSMPSSLGTRLLRCQVPRSFSVNSVEPMTLNRGHVTVVALLTSTCGFCIEQSQRLETLRQEFQENGQTVRFFIVNSGVGASPTNIENLSGIVSFPVYQDNSQEQIWRNIFKGTKDDIFVFNRCGMLTYHIRFPMSYLGYSYVRRAIQRTIDVPDICSNCQQPSNQDSDERMMGDAPAVSVGNNQRGTGGHHQRGTGGHHQRGTAGHHQRTGRRDQDRNRSHCPPGDHLCLDMLRSQRRYDKLRRQNRITGSLNQNNERMILQSLGELDTTQEQHPSGMPSL